MSNKQYTAHELLIEAIRNSPTASEMVNSQKMTVDDLQLSHFVIHTPTPEEKAADDKSWNDIKTVRIAIREKHPIGTEFIQDSIPCPICKDGIVSFIISDHYNGHIHAKCSKGCVDWME